MRYVLAGFDGSERSRLAAVHAADIADRCSARLHVLMVTRVPSAGLDTPVSDEIVEEIICRATGQLETLRSQLVRGFPQLTVRFGEPAQEIARYALEFGVQHVFLGQSRRLMPRLMSTGWRVERLLAGTDCRVTIVSARAPSVEPDKASSCEASGGQIY